MRFFKFLTVILLTSIFFSCGSNSANKVLSDFSITTNTKGNTHTISAGETLTISINNPKNHTIESIEYTLNGKKIENKLPLNNIKLGRQIIEATVHYNGQTQTAKQTVTILSNITPKIYSFKIINEYPHDITSFTQGLEFYNGDLYEGTGQPKESKLRKINYKTGEVLKNIDLADEYFGEGITVLNNNIYQLTWKHNIGFIYDVTTFKKKSSFKYNQSKEGWGLCNDGDVIYKSDGTEKIWILDPETLVEKEYIEAYTNNGRVNELNELEWVNGKIYANRWQLDGVAIINPINGAVEGVIDFSSLKEKVTQHENLDVLNGIAYNSDTNTLFVTGKYWDKIFEVEVIKN
ncbi:glutaminyl-peptide cyclotransferase [Flavobacteriaceae bacterium AU392]|nr:glutaminyl-peptide cyclotransferase [Flavobacteriaceae bacterium]RKM86072.1 glutaminyl-peptide cyclotransferase [Flavobacteriaceae bacterium AU392]